MLAIMKQTISIGNQDFASIRNNDYFYIDKSDFIKEWWESGDSVTLITRPRRFGKTLNMSMTDYFFSNQYQDADRLFEGLSIWENEKYRALRGSRPVIFLSFAAVKGATYQVARESILRLLVKLYGRYHFLLDSEIMTEQDRKEFCSVELSMTDSTAAFTLYSLSDYLSRFYGKKALILLDEYDTPLQEAYVNGYWDEMVNFIRSLFNAAFKTNPFLERGLLTGITRVSKESVFSDLNNLEVVTTTSHKYQTAFGFTETEVSAALKDMGLLADMEKVKHWYDGFRFGDTEGIYNPWSITKYLDTEKFRSYWANTSSNSLIGKMIRESAPDIKIAMEHLLEGETIEASVDEEIVFNQLDDSNSAIWSLLLASGYLRVEDISEDEDNLYNLALTNFEVQNMFRSMIRDWFDRPSAKYNEFVKALLAGDLVYMNRFMNQMTDSVFSFFDTGGKPSRQEPERFYHGFVLGLIADSQIAYRITSNRESGFGRYDVMMEPQNKNDPAYIFEFKVYDPEREKTLEDTVAAALRQIKEKNYDAMLAANGIPREHIVHYGFAFEGKNVLIG